MKPVIEKKRPMRKKGITEGRVVVYGTVETDEFSGWAKAFESRHPSITVDYRREYVYGSPPPMAKKIMSEEREGKETADVVIASIPPMIQMQRLNLLRAYKSQNSLSYPTELVQESGYWTSLIALPTVQIYNTELKRDDLPVSIIDLANEKWRGLLCIHDVTLGTFGSSWLSSLKPLMGNLRWKAFVSGLARNKPKLFPLFDQIIDSVANGETRVALTALLHDVIKAKDAHRPVERLHLSDLPILSTYNAIGIVARGRHPPAAESLVDFLLSDEGQKEIGNSYVRIPAKAGSDAKYSLKRIIPNDRIVHFPADSSQASMKRDLALFKRLFVHRES